MLKRSFNIELGILFFVMFWCIHTKAQEDLNTQMKEAVQSLNWREVGPAVMGGRISDIAISPSHSSTWYVSAGSGNLWKTTNSGITWTPVFDHEKSYSIGDIAIDPHHPDVVWVGTGENVSGRHVGWGNGVYKTMNGGKSWKNMGLESSEHIGKILIDPRNSEVVYVAAEGPLWSAGGQRGVFKSTNGGENWELVLEIDENTGVTDIEFAPGNPDVIYAAAYQRRRHTWSLLAGGPESGIYKTTNGGATWSLMTKGLPQGNMGKIGLGVTPANPNLVYATIEANDKEKGLYRSDDQGASWQKGSSYISGGTGPHYYQEIEISPTDPDLIYQMDVFLHVSRDGGKSFDYLGTGREKHSDNHALWIDPKNDQHLLAGTDAGLYESFDEGLTWRHFPNMPISQFYKLDIDNDLPFYNILGGAQDLGTLIGPSRTLNAEGVRNQDWYVPLGADGYDSQFDPTDPNIAYMEIQGGLLHRYDKKTHEVLNIQPQPGPNDPPERWNWDSPNLVSPHNSDRLYFGSQRLWKSEDQGNSWEVISEDLTTNTNRYTLELMDRVWSVDDLYDNGAMSLYATLTSIDESPVVEGLIYTGSDDGLVHVTEDGGQNWRQSKLPQGIPERSFINDIEASRHDASVVFAAIDAHKLGDYQPYLLMSSDKGYSWKSITGDLPKETIVWVIKQDYEDPDLLFIGTEYGVYFSYNQGVNWIELGGGVPTIPFRDLEIHERDHDIVGATFGRGFYILDDYTPLRSMQEVVSEQSNHLFPIRDAWWYIPSVPMQAKGMPTLGSTSFVAENPSFGATLTYFLSEIPQTKSDMRKEREEEMTKNKASIPFPGWEELNEEKLESSPQVLLLISNENDQPVRWIEGTISKGLNRVNWDLRLPAPNAIDLSKPGFTPPWAGTPQGPLAAPGSYTAQLYILNNGTLTAQGEPQEFNVKPIPALEEKSDFKKVSEFQKMTSEFSASITDAGGMMSDAGERLRYLGEAIKKTPAAKEEHFKALKFLSDQLAELRIKLYGDPVKRGLNESTSPTLSSRVGQVAYGHWDTTHEPTQVFIQNIEMAKQEFNSFLTELMNYLKDLSEFEDQLDKAGAPFTKGRRY
ncbi:WD40/YVTN/BNR-like repeat-containing protein [Portibacter marinus]|uniref:WD40/YVTN/BNR-like repeat-containing protein n=1 Tax=Portibacter marinus TaxID=2898660 RepID=UPI001F1DE95D|nr:glycosyl hydrolase [Portibacter marinus]